MANALGPLVLAWGALALTWLLQPQWVPVVSALGLALLVFWLNRQASRRVQALAADMTDDLRHLALVARKTSNAVVITDAQRRITWVNEGFEKLTGYSAEEALGRSPGALLQFKGTDPWTIQQMRLALNKGVPFKGDVFNRAKDGRTYWLELDIQPVKDDQGQLTGFIAIESDITDRMEGEQATHAARAFLDQTGRIGGIGGWAFEIETRALQCTEQTCRILDLDPGHPLTVADVLVCCPAQVRQDIELAIAENFQARTEWDVEIPMTTHEGRRIWVRLLAEGAYSDGGLHSMIGAIQDITARKDMQAEVERNAQLLRGAIDTIDEAFVLFDPDDRLVICNEKYLQIYETSRDLLVPGARFEDIVRQGVARGQYPEAVGMEEAWITDRLAHYHRGNMALVKQLDNGRVVRLLERKMADGHTVGFRVDITDLARATEAAEQAIRAQSEFIATISHELRTPLQSIMGFSDLGMHFMKDQPQFLQMFTDIHHGGKRMLNLVNGLLDVSKLDKQEGSLELRVVDLKPLIHDVTQELAHLAQQGALTLNLQQADPPLMAQAHTFRFQQVIRNVLANAIRFAPAGSIIALQARLVHTPGQEPLCRIEVQDQGPGIPDDELDTIFEPFVQSSRTRDGAGGTGLGLAICRKIMGAHGGRITARNAAHGGAIICIELPALPREPAALPTPNMPTSDVQEAAPMPAD